MINLVRNTPIYNPYSSKNSTPNKDFIKKSDNNTDNLTFGMKKTGFVMAGIISLFVLGGIVSCDKTTSEIKQKAVENYDGVQDFSKEVQKSVNDEFNTMKGLVRMNNYLDSLREADPDMYLLEMKALYKEMNMDSVLLTKGVKK